MFDEVAAKYDLANDLLSFGSAHFWRKAVLRAVSPASGQRILDLAAGTGSSSAALNINGAKVIAADFSKGMLEVGRERHPELEFVFADAQALPFADNEFDCVTISFGLRNIQDTSLGLAEMLRVLKPAGKLVVCEFSKIPNAALNGLYVFYLKHLLPRIVALVSKTPEAYTYLADSIEAWPNQRSLSELIQAVGFEGVNFKNLSLGIVALHIAFKPEQS